MTRYAASLTDLDRIWKTPSGCALLDASLDGQEVGDSEVVTAGGADATVLRGTPEHIAALVTGLLERDVRVYHQVEGIAGFTKGRWVRTYEAPEAPELPEDPIEFGDADDWPHIDAEFAALCGMQTPAERAGLRESIATHGCRDPLVLWEEKDILLDGHNRLAVCRELDVDFDTVEYSFPDRDAARAWIIDNALARRSLTVAQRRYLRGKRLLAEKKAEGRPQKLPQIEGVSGETAERIAEREGVSRATVERDASFAQALDALGAPARAAILTGEVRVSRAVLATAAEQGVRTPKALVEMKAASATPPDPLARLEATSERLLRQIDELLATDLHPDDRARLSAFWTLPVQVGRLACEWPDAVAAERSDMASDEAAELVPEPRHG